MALLRRVARLLAWSRAPEAKPNAQCPICERPVVIAAQTMDGNQFAGPMFSPATREERAACPEHGHAPYNAASMRLPER
jgi:hypothetical protein